MNTHYTDSSSSALEHWPTEIRLNKEKNALSITFNSGETFMLEAEFLRVYSPSADVRGHSGQERKIIGGKRSVTIQNIESVGNYAVKLVFSDGHDTGLYSWTYLHDLGTRQKTLWQEYVQALAEKGLSRA